MKKKLFFAAGILFLLAAPIIAENNVLLHLSFDGAVGDILLDSSGNGNHGIAVGTCKVKGKKGLGLQFPGRGNYILIPDSLSLKTKGPFTIDFFWYIQDDSLARASTLFVRSGNYHSCVAGGSLCFRGIKKSMDSLTGWHHFCFVYDGSYAKVYIDGEFFDEKETGKWKFNDKSINDLIIGQHDRRGFHPLKGVLDEYRILSGALSEDEIREYYTSIMESTTVKKSTTVLADFSHVVRFRLTDETYLPVSNKPVNITVEGKAKITGRGKYRGRKSARIISDEEGIVSFTLKHEGEAGEDLRLIIDSDSLKEPIELVFTVLEVEDARRLVNSMTKAEIFKRLRQQSEDFGTKLSMLKRTKVETFRPGQRSAMVLAKDGKPGAAIIIRDDASDLQKEPADDLQEYIYKISGAVLPIVDDSKAPDGNLILVGESKLTKKMGIRIDELTGDSFIIKTAPGRLVLAGNDGQVRRGTSRKRGTANAVNVFLQDYCGVHWFMPGELGEVVPKRKTLEIPKIDKREKLFRLYSHGRFHTLWGRRNFFGASSVFLRHYNGHIWYSLIPQKRYFKEHPEWFALLGGKRTGKGNHLCTTNKEMQAEALKNLKKICAQGYEMIELGQTDGYQRCRCEKCEAMDEYRDNVGYAVKGKPADRIWVFHDYLAREVHKTYPDMKIIIICYGPTYEVPKRIEKLPDYVTVELCHPDPESVERWTKFHDKFTVYLYWFTSEMRDYFPVSLFQVAAEFERLTYAGVRGYFFCGGGNCWGTNAPTYYLIGRLLRDPRLNEYAQALKSSNGSANGMLNKYGQELVYPEKYVDEILDEFCEGLFGKAGKPMKEFFKTFHMGIAQKMKIIFEPKGKAAPKDIYTKCFSDDIINTCDRSLKEAEKLTDDAVVRKRISFFRDGYEYHKFTALGFARLKDYEEESSEEKLSALKESVIRRNKFVKEMYERQLGMGKLLPPVIPGSLEILLYGPKKQFQHPFKMDVE